MTVSTTAARAEYTGNGSTTAFAVVDTGGASAVIPVLDATHLQVYVDGTLKTKDTHYTVSIVAATKAATVTFKTSPSDNTPANSTSIVILRVVPYTQLQDYVNNDAFDAENVETALDQLTQANQQIVDDKDRSIKFSATIASSDFNSDEETASKITAVKADRINKTLGFDSNGDISVTQDLGTYQGTDATTTTKAYVPRDIVKSSTAGQLNNLYICKVASPLGTALTNTTYWDLVIDAYAAASSVTTATSKATEASRSEDNAEAYAQTAENTQTTVYADVTSSSTSNDGYSALHYREKAKEWAGTGTSHPLVTDDSGSNIAGEYSAKAWASKGSGTVDGSTKSAKLSASDAATSETNAAASATAAAASAAAVANALDSFDDKYLGVMADNASATTATLTGASCAKDASSITFTGSSGTITVGQELTSTGTGYPSSANIIGTSTTSPITISAPFTAAISSVSLTFTGQGVYGAWDGSKDGPSTDNDGNALVNGALYYNSTDGEMRVYDTSSGTWIAASAAQNATVEDYTYTLSGSVQNIEGSDDNSATLSFSNQESVDVFLNGVKLVPKIGGTANDYHLDTSNRVTLASTAVSGDVILVRVYKTFTVGDAVPASTGGTFSGNVAYTGNIQVDDIIEKSADHGVEIDGVTLKDGGGTFTGNLLVGTTNSNPTGASVAGASIDSSGEGNFSVDGGEALRLNRKTSDGEILNFRKDGTTVGYIGTYGDDMTVGTGDTGIRFIDSLECIVPVSDAAGTSRDNAVDLGYSTIRYKNLYLSGGVYLGGTWGANKIDDYEEGTFNPTLFVGTAQKTLSRDAGAYIKIGGFVHLQMAIIVSGSITESGQVQIRNLPFSAPGPDTGGHARGTGSVAYTNAGIIPIGVLGNGGDRLDLWRNNSGTLSSTLQGSDISVSDWNIHLSISMATF